MGIEVASSFTRKAPVPLDDSTVVADLTARDAIDPGIRYIGMIVFVESEGVNFQLVGGITDGDWQELSGGGGSSGVGSSLQWKGDPGLAPLQEQEYGFLPWIFGSGLGQSISSGFKVPANYKPGKQLTLVIPNYVKATTTDDRTVRLVSTLIQPATGYISDTTNQHTSDVTLTAGTLNRPDFTTHEITDSVGEINSVAVSPGDFIRLEIKRVDSPSDELADDFRVLTELIEGPK